MTPVYRSGFVRRLLRVIALILTAVFVTVTWVTQRDTRNILRQNAIDTGLQRIQTEADFLELYMDQLSQLFNTIYARADIYSKLHEAELNSADSYSLFLFVRSLYFVPREPQLYQIYLDLSTSGQSYIYREQGSSFGPSRYHVTLPEGLSAGKAFGDGPHLSSNYGYSLNTPAAEVYSLRWNIYNSVHREILGTMSFDVEVAELAKTVFRDAAEDGSVNYLISGDGTIIYAGGTPLSQQEIASVVAECKGRGWAEYQSDAIRGIVFTSSAEINGIQVRLIRVIPEKTLFAEPDRILRRNILIFTAALLILCLLIILSVQSMFRPVRDLSRYVSAVGQHGIKTQISDYVQYDKDDEIGQLVNYTGEMMRDINDLFEKQEQLSRAQRTAEAKLLQAQINPHFLYNALQSIAGLSLQHGDRETYRYISMLGSRMQYSMNLDQTVVELKREFRYVESYLALQNVRFGNVLTTDIRLDPEAEDIPVPKMILQPLAENAFKHGKLCRAPGAFFRMTAELEDSGPENGGAEESLHPVLRILMENNGGSCPPERMAELNAAFASVRTEPGSSVSASGSPDSETPGSGAAVSGIGMQNVLYRLRLYYGPDVSMHMDAPENGGVRITVRIPLHERH
ncbi:MAG: histidine kinase [Stomatobaculum sp.]|nr:histidine kinase [Stomatobaculum sp.]